MTDIKPFIAGLLGKTANVELSFSERDFYPPVIILSETENEAEIIISGSERVSRITVQLDVYHKTVQETEELAAKVSGILTAAGLRRSFSEGIYNERKPRKCMRFTCGIDEAEGRILAL
ncbi:MAG: hypothetical protein IJ416_09495 [Ruminiclostridium sp.]|nr:hypothetical protein [Ruminiclostridium sp.]